MIAQTAEAATLEPVVVEFVRSQGLAGGLQVKPLSGGGNNRVLLIRSDAQERVLKCYFQSAGDPRDRFGAESAFYQLISEAGIRQAPRAFGWDRRLRLGLLEHVRGATIENVADAHIEQAIEFIAALQAAREKPAAARVGVAADSCVRLEDHLNRVEERLQRIGVSLEANPASEPAQRFVADELKPAWVNVREKTLERARAHGAEWPAKPGCLSPSDFGYHNAIETRGGRLVFFDFEYAGWDDPVKLACDFFCQPRIPVPMRYWDRVVSAMAEATGDVTLPRRAPLLLPVSRIKWCCIILNEFVGADSARREFARGGAVPAERRLRQLELARAGLRVAMGGN
jgi:hypothetical protein